MHEIDIICFHLLYAVFFYEGGADSTATATIVGCMCRLVYDSVKKDPNSQVASDCRRICLGKDDGKWVPSSSQEIAGHIFHTLYLGSEHSSTATTARSKGVAEAIGAYHLYINIDIVVSALLTMFVMVTKLTPRFKSNGGTWSEDLALQNIQG